MGRRRLEKKELASGDLTVAISQTVEGDGNGGLSIYKLKSIKPINKGFISIS
jgi:hypothetical protein